MASKPNCQTQSGLWIFENLFPFSKGGIKMHQAYKKPSYSIVVCCYFLAKFCGHKTTSGFLVYQRLKKKGGANRNMAFVLGT